MIAIIIIIIAACLVALILTAPVSLKISYDGTGFIVIRYLFLKFKISLPPEKKPHEKQNKKQRDDNVSYLKKLVQKQGAANAVLEILEIIKAVVSELFKLFPKVKIQYLNLDLNVGQSDAAETGIAYGAVSAAVYTAVAAVNAMFGVEKQRININADFDHEILEFSFRAAASVRVFRAVAAGIRLLLKLTKLKINKAAV